MTFHSHYTHTLCYSLLNVNESMNNLFIPTNVPITTIIIIIIDARVRTARL
jgi:hypothetical protein